MLIKSKGHMISEEDKQVHVGQLHVCPHFGGASIRRLLQIIWTGKRLVKKSSQHLFDLPKYLSPKCPEDELSSKTLKYIWNQLCKTSNLSKSTGSQFKPVCKTTPQSHFPNQLFELPSERSLDCYVSFAKFSNSVNHIKSSPLLSPTAIWKLSNSPPPNLVLARISQSLYQPTLSPIAARTHTLLTTTPNQVPAHFLCPTSDCNALSPGLYSPPI